jgi:beta-lactamase regulating signal transducer with metallopeptidase domain
MHDVLSKLLQANLVVAAAILLVLALRKGARRAFGARIAYGLWLLVPMAAAASLAPPKPVGFLAARHLAPAPLLAAAQEGASALWTWGADAAPTGLDPAPVAFGLWLAGLVLTVGWLAWRQSQFLMLLRHGEAGPAVVGFLKPRIVTPSDFEARFDRREQTVVLAHEKIHLARHDARINALVALGRCVCWFNPLVHLAAHLMRVDQELACDAAVVERHPKARAPYAQALLKAQLAAKPLPLGCYWPAGTEHPLTERIAMLKSSNPSKPRRLAGAALVTVLAAGAGYAAWAAAPSTAPAASAPLNYIQQALPAVAPAGVTPAPAAAAVGAPIARRVAPAVHLAAADPSLSHAPAPSTESAAQTGKVTYVGSAQIPARQPFVRYYDGASPVKFRGRVTGMRLTDGMSSDFTVQAEDGKLYRVIGGDPASLSPEGRAQAQALLGATIDVRGYLAYDQTCEGGCIVNGRDVSFPDGSAVITR